MWFKNLRLYRFQQPFRLPAERLETQLAVQAFSACGRLEMSSYGFVPPAGGGTEQLVHVTNGFLLLCACREEKLLPNTVVREAAAERIETMEAERGTPVPRRERERVSDDVRFELLPRAFTRSQRTYAYVDPLDGWLLVDAATDARADQFIEVLGDALGSLPVAFPVTQERPSALMTQWLLHGSPPQDFELERECELRLPGEGGAVVRCRNQDLTSHEIHTHLEAGKEAIRVSLTYAERLSFVLDEKLNVRRLRFLELIRDEAAEVDADDPIQRLDTDFAVMSLELRAFVRRLIEVFGGEDSAAMGLEGS